MKLTVTSAGGRSEAIELGRQVVLGRDPSCDVVLDDHLVSRRHAQLEVDDSGRMVIRDLGSRNGTFVNGQRIEGAVVLAGTERIGIGDAEISLAPEVAPAPPPEEADRMVGTTLGRYRIEAKIDEGAMGAVYLAEHTRLGKHVALKVMGQRLFRNQVARQRFVDESRTVASLDHPNIIPVFDADEIGDELFIAMRYVDGEDLGRLLDREGALDPERAINIVAQVGSALDAAHSRGLIHRDVKPGNILIASARDSAGAGHAFLCDFGITKNLASSGLTATGQTLGTPNYMAPEQFKGQPVDGRTDLYALGCVLYECLTGTPPYPGDTFETVMYGHLMTAPPPPTAHQPALPPGLDAVVAKAMAKDPADRYATCAELVAAARAALAAGTARART
nr:serine/threonine-protein kinase [Actinomycetota bacterium]